MNFQDEEVRGELERIDPHDLFGFISLGSTIINVVYSLLHNFYTFDVLISISFILGLLSVLHKNSRMGKISIVVLVIHLGAIGLLRLLS